MQFCADLKNIFISVSFFSHFNSTVSINISWDREIFLHLFEKIYELILTMKTRSIKHNFLRICVRSLFNLLLNLTLSEVTTIYVNTVQNSLFCLEAPIKYTKRFHLVFVSPAHCLNLGDITCWPIRSVNSVLISRCNLVSCVND